MSKIEAAINRRINLLQDWFDKSKQFDPYDKGANDAYDFARKEEMRALFALKAELAKEMVENGK